MGEPSFERSLAGHFAPLEDPRDALRRRHKLIEMVVIAIAAVLCGVDGWVAIAAFGRAKESWLRQFLELPHGIPSHDTFGRVFSVLAPEAFERCFRSCWVEVIRAVIPGEVIALDGKTLRRSHDRKAGIGALHLVSAWASANRVVLGQVATEAKSNEITAIPQLLTLLHIQGCIVTIDAMGCQTKIAAQIIAQGGNYLLALKGNQGTLESEVQEAFIGADARDYVALRAASFDYRNPSISRWKYYWDLMRLPCNSPPSTAHPEAIVAGYQSPDVTRERLRDNYLRIRHASEQSCEPLAIDDYQLQSMASASPPKWHLGHVTWFFETFLLQPFAAGYSAFHPHFDYLFNSYYYRVGTMQPRAERGLLSRPAVEQVYEYRTHVDRAMLGLIEDCKQGDWPLPFGSEPLTRCEYDSPGLTHSVSRRC